jgi:acid stress-induced BolA-like protein IbaG/YrbA
VNIAVTLRGLFAILHIMDPVEITRLIEAGFSDATVQVKSDDNTHYGALVVAAEFDGKRLLARHQLVYQSLGALVGNEIHALSITALTPDEWRQRSGEG